MFGFLNNIDRKHMSIFAAGVLFGTAGIKLLSSRDAKKVYTSGTAAVLRAKDYCMKTAAVVQENAEDIYAEAIQINEERAKQEAEQVISDEDNREGEAFSREGEAFSREGETFSQEGEALSGEENI